MGMEGIRFELDSMKINDLSGPSRLGSIGPTAFRISTLRPHLISRTTITRHALRLLGSPRDVVIRCPSAILGNRKPSARARLSLVLLGLPDLINYRRGRIGLIAYTIT